jgi:ketosteroid isomerase-like protein
MSSGQIVRQPIRVRERSSRTLEHRLALRFPRLGAAYARLIGRLPPSSRLRQAALRRGARLAVEAYNRGDLDALLIGHRPDCDFHPPREFVEAALLEPCYRGLAGYRLYHSAWSAAWGTDLRIEPVELIDLGDRVVVLSDQPVRGQASGVPFTGKGASVLTVKDGMVIAQQDYFDHTEALEAVGLRE